MICVACGDIIHEGSYALVYPDGHCEHNPPPPEPQRYEIMICEAATKFTAIGNAERLSSEGWEPFAASSEERNSINCHTLYFRRPVPASPEEEKS